MLLYFTPPNDTFSINAIKEHIIIVIEKIGQHLAYYDFYDSVAHHVLDYPVSDLDYIVGLGCHVFVEVREDV